MFRSALFILSVKKLERTKEVQYIKTFRSAAGLVLWSERRTFSDMLLHHQVQDAVNVVTALQGHIHDLF
jgi:hypothetical protein